MQHSTTQSYVGNKIRYENKSVQRGVRLRRSGVKVTLGVWYRKMAQTKYRRMCTHANAIDK